MFTREEYTATVRRALEYIAAGDVFQVNLSQRFAARGRSDPLDLYLRLKAASPAPFSAFLRWDDLAVVSRQPRMVLPDPGRPHRHPADQGDPPARGDRRGRRPARRRAGRQPQGPRRADHDRRPRTQRPGARLPVRLGPRRRARSLSRASPRCTTWSRTVEGRSAPGVGPVDVIRALFPGGSITGAPKIRAMEIIDELEPTRRSLYTGAIGYLGRGGTSDFNIAIRTDPRRGRSGQLSGRRRDRRRLRPRGRVSRRRSHKGRALREVIEGSGGRAMIWVRGQIVADEAADDQPCSTARSSTASGCSRPSAPGTGIPRSCSTATSTGCDDRPDALGLPLDPDDLARRHGRPSLATRAAHAGDAVLRITLSGGLAGRRTGSTLWMRPGPCPRRRARGGRIVRSAPRRSRRP